MNILNDITSKKTKSIFSGFSTQSKLLQGFSQGTVLGPILFNIYLSNRFYLTEMTQLYKFADVCDNDLNTLINRLEDDT